MYRDWSIQWTFHIDNQVQILDTYITLCGLSDKIFEKLKSYYFHPITYISYWNNQLEKDSNYRCQYNDAFNDVFFGDWHQLNQHRLRCMWELLYLLGYYLFVDDLALMALMLNQRWKSRFGTNYGMWVTQKQELHFCVGIVIQATSVMTWNHETPHVSILVEPILAVFSIVWKYHGLVYAILSM